MTNRRLWGLGALALALHWCEELLALANGPLLMLGAGVALTDLLTDGKLTASLPLLLYVWAVSQAAGVDLQLLGCFARARDARGWHRCGWLILGAVLAVAAWQAGYVFATQQAEGVTEAAALAQLGMPAPLWLGERAALAVGLVALSGWTRYRPPAQTSANDERAALERELTLEPLRAQVRMRRAMGWRSLAQGIVQGDAHGDAQDGAGEALTGTMMPNTASHAEAMPAPAQPQIDPSEPTPDHVPGMEHMVRPNGHSWDNQVGSAAPTTPLALVPRPPTSVQAAHGRIDRAETLRTQAYALLSEHPGMSRNQLRDALKVRRETANALYDEWERERRKQASR